MTDTAVRGWSLPAEGRASISETNAKNEAGPPVCSTCGVRPVDSPACPNRPFPQVFIPHQYSTRARVLYGDQAFSLDKDLNVH